MTKVSVEISEDLDFMNEIPKIQWTILVNRILQEKLREISKMKRIISKSKLTEEDAEEISDKINEGLAKRYS